MSTESENPLLIYIKEQMAHFGAEGQRLRDTKPLEDYKALVDTMLFIERRLGTIEHEVALHRLDGEFGLAWSEGRSAWKEIWTEFAEQRRAAIRTEEMFKAGEKQSAKILADLEKSYAEKDHKNEELRRSMRAMLDASKAVELAGAKLGEGWWKGPWLFLWVNLSIYSAYVRYFFSRAGFFLFRHAFIFVASILVLGIVYSKASGYLVQSTSSLATQWPWLAGIVTILVYALKKYYLDAKLKKFQVALETKRLKPLVIHLHMIRTRALAFRTLERSASPSAQVHER